MHLEPNWKAYLGVSILPPHPTLLGFKHCMVQGPASGRAALPGAVKTDCLALHGAAAGARRCTTRTGRRDEAVAGQRPEPLLQGWSRCTWCSRRTAGPGVLPPQDSRHHLYVGARHKLRAAGGLERAARRLQGFQLRWRASKSTPHYHRRRHPLSLSSIIRHQVHPHQVGQPSSSSLSSW